MRTLFTIPLVLMSLVSFPCWGLSMDDLVQREGLWYKKFTDIPFTGKIEGVTKGSFKNGKRNGHWVGYDQTGQLAFRGYYKDGQLEGEFSRYQSNGRRWYLGKYFNDVQHGYWEAFYDNGQLESKGNYQDGFKEGSREYYHPNGQLMDKGKYKNDKEEVFWKVTGTMDSYFVRAHSKTVREKGLGLVIKKMGKYIIFSQEHSKTVLR